MAISPCNTLNVKTLRISQLASATIGANDLIAISSYDNTTGAYFSKKSTMTNLGSYIATYLGTVDSTYSGNFSGKVTLNTGITGSIHLPTTVGTVTSKYLPIKLNGTTYKILLYNT